MHCCVTFVRCCCVALLVLSGIASVGAVARGGLAAAQSSTSSIFQTDSLSRAFTYNQPEPADVAAALAGASSSASSTPLTAGQLDKQLDSIPWHQYSREQIADAFRQAFLQHRQSPATTRPSGDPAEQAGSSQHGSAARERKSKRQSQRTLAPRTASSQQGRPIDSTGQNQTAGSGVAALAEQLRELAEAIVKVQPGIPCSRDATLPEGALAGDFLFCMNFHNNEAVLPHFTVQLLAVLSRTARDRVFVSIYESGSTDQTGPWLAVLKRVLNRIGVPNRIVVGGRRRRPGEDRIKFLAEMRNKALEPLWQGGNGGGVSTGGATMRGAPGHQFSASTRIVFLNDVYFCGDHVTRLLLQEGDLLCGMDFSERTWELVRHNHPAPAHLMRPFGPYGPKYAVPSALIPEWVFYDVWVARDIDGLPLSNFKPYASDAYTRMRLQAGLPFPSRCCWNGIAIVTAAPFLQGLKFRAHYEGECSASEISLLCNDFLRLGYDRIAMDPNVRVAYELNVAQALYGRKLPLIPALTWRNLTIAPPIDWDYVPERSQVFCCNKEADSDQVDWGHCFPEDVYARNWTADALAAPVALPDSNQEVLLLEAGNAISSLRTLDRFHTAFGRWARPNATDAQQGGGAALLQQAGTTVSERARLLIEEAWEDGW